MRFTPASERPCSRRDWPCGILARKVLHPALVRHIEPFDEALLSALFSSPFEGLPKWSFRKMPLACGGINSNRSSLFEW